MGQKVGDQRFQVASQFYEIQIKHIASTRRSFETIFAKFYCFHNFRANILICTKIVLFCNIAGKMGRLWSYRGIYYNIQITFKVLEGVLPATFKREYQFCAFFIFSGIKKLEFLQTPRRFTQLHKTPPNSTKFH